MKVRAYRIVCITNLHMGAGAKNYGIVDLEVQRDVVTSEPTMHASGIKGALRSYAEHYHRSTAGERIDILFGKKPKKEKDLDSEAGSLVFFDGDLAFRPCRSTGGSRPFQPCTSYSQVALILDKAAALGVRQDAVLEPPPESPVPVSFGNASDASVEGLKRAADGGSDNAWLNAARWLFPSEEGFVMLGDSDFNNIGLPIIAHNSLNEHGESENLWWQEVVPHGSVFVTFVGGYDDSELDDFEKFCGIGKADSAPLQFGADRSVGLGFATMEKLA